MRKITKPNEISCNLLINQCIHQNKERSVVYRGIHKQKKALMCIKLLQIKTNQSFKCIEAQITNFFQFYKKKYSYQTTQQIPNHLLQIAKLKTDKNQKYCYFISRPYIEGHTLSHLIKSQPQIVNKNNVKILFKNMLSMLVSFGGIKNYILTSTNIIVGQFGQLDFIPTSFEGLLFLKEEAYIKKHQFINLYPYLDSKLLLRQKRNKINVSLKIRSLVVNLLKAVLGEEFNLISEQIKQQCLNISNDCVKKLIQEIPHKFRQFLKQDRVINKIKEYQNCGIQLNNLFQQILVKEQTISYAQLINYFYNGKNINYLNDLMYSSYHKNLWEKQQLKDYYVKRGLDSVQTYIPAKYGKQLSDVLGQSAWYERIQSNQSNPSVKNIVYSLLQQIFNKEQQYTKIKKIYYLDKQPLYQCLRKYVKQSKLKFKIDNQNKNQYNFSTISDFLLF